jgi:hypothetical protein
MFIIAAIAFLCIAAEPNDADRLRKQWRDFGADSK